MEQRERNTKIVNKRAGRNLPVSGSGFSKRRRLKHSIKQRHLTGQKKEIEENRNEYRGRARVVRQNVDTDSRPKLTVLGF